MEPIDWLSTVLFLAIGLCWFALARHIASSARPQSPPPPLLAMKPVTKANKAVTPFLDAGEVEAAAAALPRHMELNQYLDAGVIILRLQRTAASGSEHNLQAQSREVLMRLAPPPVAKRVLERYGEATTALRMIREEHTWRRMTSTSANGARQTYMRREAGLLWIKTSARMPVPMEHALAVCSLADLYKTWYPCCVASEVLATVSATEVIFRLENHYVPMPWLTIRDDVLVHTYLVDCGREAGGLLACGSSPLQSSWPGVSFPAELSGRYSGRTHLHALQFFCEPRHLDASGGALDGAPSCDVTLQLAVRDPCVPDWLLSFVFSKTLALLFAALGDAAARIAAEPAASAHAQAILSHPELFERVLPAMMATWGEGTPPPEATPAEAAAGTSRVPPPDQSTPNGEQRRQAWMSQLAATKGAGGGVVYPDCPVPMTPPLLLSDELLLRERARRAAAKRPLDECLVTCVAAQHSPAMAAPAPPYLLSDELLLRERARRAAAQPPAPLANCIPSRA